MRSKLPTSITSRVSLLSHHLSVIHVNDICPKISVQPFFRFLSPLFHNFVICAYPFPPVFGLFSALPASFVAATGLPLRLFVPQAAEKSRPRHPRAPRRRMSSRKVRNLQQCPFPHVFNLFSALCFS
jgi:hypothetical protein